MIANRTNRHIPALSGVGGIGSPIGLLLILTNAS